MSSIKVSALTAKTTPSGSEELLINDGGTSKKITIDNVTENNFTDTLKSKLDAIEASADVTDTTNVTSAGALMDSEVTNLAAVKAFATSDYATAAQGTTADAAFPKAGGTMTGDVSLGDGVKANFGASDDLQIYHVGNNSYINDAGAGDLIMYGANLRLGHAGTGEQFLHAYGHGRVDLFYDNAVKLATTSTGIDVTGSVTCDGFTSTGIDDNATGTKLTISDTTITGVGAFTSTSIDATKLSGDLPAIDGASLTGFTDAQMPAGSVVQVVSSTNTTHYSTTSSSVQQGPQTGTLTLKNTSNKVLVTVTFIVRMTKTGGGAQGGRYAIYRGSIASGTKLTAGSEPQHYFNDPGTESYILTTLTYYDTPGANTTYSLGYYKHPAGTTAEIHGGFFTTHFTMQEVSV